LRKNPRASLGQNPEIPYSVLGLWITIRQSRQQRLKANVRLKFTQGQLSKALSKALRGHSYSRALLEKKPQGFAGAKE